MKFSTPLSILAICVLGTASVSLGDQDSIRELNREALVLTANRAKALAFETDKPVSEARLLVNGKVKATEKWNSETPGFKMVVVQPSRVHAKPGQSDPEIQFHVETSNMGGLLSGQYRPIREANLYNKYNFGPGKNLTLTGWTTVYGEQHQLGTSVVYEVRVEIR